MEQDRKFIIQCAFILILFLSVFFYIWYDMTHQAVKVQHKPKKQHSEYFYEWHENNGSLVDTVNGL